MNFSWFSYRQLSCYLFYYSISNIPNNTNFEFDKSWLLEGNPSDWPDDVEEITVTLKRIGTNKKGESVENEVTFTVKNDPNQKIDLSKISGSTITSGIVTQIVDPSNPNRYHYKITDLDKYIEGETAGAGNEWTYSISEMEISGFNKPRYILHGSDTAIDTAESTDNGGTIVNDRSSIELPETGGPGTIWMFCLGVGLVLIALLGFVTRSDLTRR